MAALAVWLLHGRGEAVSGNDAKQRFFCPRGHRHFEASEYCTLCGAGPVTLASRMSAVWRRAYGWWLEDRPVYWIHGRWEWGWLGNGWNRLALGKIAVYFKADVPALIRSHGWLWND